MTLSSAQQGLSKGRPQSRRPIGAPRRQSAAPRRWSAAQKSMLARSHQLELKADVKDLKADIKDLKEETGNVLKMLRAQRAMVTDLLELAHGVEKDNTAPKLVCFLPPANGEKKFFDLLKQGPKRWFSQRVRLCFVDPIGMTLAKRKGGELGFEIDYPKRWVKESLPYVLAGLTMVKCVVAVSKLTGFHYSDLDGWVSEQFAVLDEVGKEETDKEKEDLDGRAQPGAV